MALPGVVLRRLLLDPRFRRAVLTAGPVLVEYARKQRWRLVAATHAETLADGLVSRAVVDGDKHWLVWNGDEAVGIYPPASRSLADVARTADLDQRVRPEHLPERRAARQVGTGVRAAVGRLSATGRAAGQLAQQVPRPGRVDPGRRHG